MCKFVCVKSQGCIAKGCTAHLPLPPPVVQVECRSVVDDGLLVLGVFGAGPTSLFLWHIRRVRDCGLCIERLGVY